MKEVRKLKLDDSVCTLNGVGSKRAEALKKLNIESLEDMLMFFPRRYEDRRQIVSIMQAPLNRDVLLQVRVVSKQLVGNPYSKKRLLKVNVEDNSGKLELLFFNGGKFLAEHFQPNQELVLFGKISLNGSRRQMAYPEFHKPGDKADIRGLLPVYPLTEGISQNQMRSWQQEIKDSGICECAEDCLPPAIAAVNRLCSPKYALENIHFPSDERKVLEARYRLIFEELLILETGLFYIKYGTKSEEKEACICSEASVEEFEKSLSFKLTSGQKKVFREIESDMQSAKVMNRLVQGDVGSGKTAVAQLAMFKAVKSGFQAAMMAPTELLAKQHIATIKKGFEPFEIRAELLCSATGAKERAEILSELAEGKIDILVGTHAMIQPDVIFSNLGLVITDEQHRFGVNQRALLSQKGKNPDILVMTATPIPRTLAVILYGDLDISVIDTLPHGRKPIRTFARDEKAREKIYAFVSEQVKQGRQCYVVTPLIEESEKIDCRSAEEVYEELCMKYPRLRIGLVHGGMKQQEKDEVMAAFAGGSIDILVSTVVIEVGIDVANATVMVIENSERFGLAQLHQLRGRVGRGEYQSYCILISGSDSADAKKRNEIMCSTTDGFVIAEEDLKLRGPGELFGTRQHGLPELNISDLVRNTEILEKVKLVAAELIDKDPELSSPENALLKARVKKMFGERIQLRL